MSIDHHTLSGAYALDALSLAEAQLFHDHLEECPACRDEVGEFRAVVATMGASESLVAPAHLKARVLAAADHAPQLPPKVTPIEAARSTRWSAKLIGAAAAVALVVAAGIGVSQLESPSVNPVASQVFDAADSHTATVDTSNGGQLEIAVSSHLNKMAVQTSSLPQLGSKQVYQLWYITGGDRARSVGMVENVDAGWASTAPGSRTRFAITIEPAGGSILPTTDPIVEVNPRTV